MSVHNYVPNSEHGDDYIMDLDPVTLISKLNISDPLHLHPNDTTALTIVSVKLKETKNYQVWSYAMLLALEGKNKSGFIDGTCKMSNTNEVLGRQWDSVNAIVLGWILNSISEELFLGQIFLKRAKHVWEELKETYDKVDGSIIFSLHHQIHTLMQNGSSIADYYHKLNALSAYATISSEESHRVAASSIVGSSQRNQASAFVSNMPNRNNFETNNQNVSSGPSRPNNLNNIRQGGGSALVCKNCCFNGHIIDRCFKIIGYPADFGKKKFGQNVKGKNISNNNYVGSSSSSGSTNEQMAILISLIKENKIGKNMQANMAGENQHMTYTNKELDNVLDISYLKIKVGHLNGTEAFISKIRNLKLSNGLVLYDVMMLFFESEFESEKCSGD
ncbi:ribonuclease H-like domain-containing protein [Tanacetum coccineum]